MDEGRPRHFYRALAAIMVASPCNSMTPFNSFPWLHSLSCSTAAHLHLYCDVQLSTADLVGPFGLYLGPAVPCDQWAHLQPKSWSYHQSKSLDPEQHFTGGGGLISVLGVWLSCLLPPLQFNVLHQCCLWGTGGTPGTLLLEAFETAAGSGESSVLQLQILPPMEALHWIQVTGGKQPGTILLCLGQTPAALPPLPTATSERIRERLRSSQSFGNVTD